jgi:hypothetical protein
MVYEIIGYVASLLVAVSLMMSSIVKLRVINLAGALCFTIYGFLIQSYPVAGMNLFVVIIDVYYLYEMFTKKEYFTILEVKADSEYLKRFLTFYRHEITQFLPEFSFAPSDRQIIFFVLRNLVPTGLFIAEERDDTSLVAKLDFVIPGYRDFKIGQFIFSKSSDMFKKKGFHTLYSSPGNQAHERYLGRMGFAMTDSEGKELLYAKEL